MDTLRFIAAFVRIFDIIKYNSAVFEIRLNIKGQMFSAIACKDTGICEFADRLDMMQAEINKKRME